MQAETFPALLPRVSKPTYVIVYGCTTISSATRNLAHALDTRSKHANKQTL